MDQEPGRNPQSSDRIPDEMRNVAMSKQQVVLEMRFPPKKKKNKNKTELKWSMRGRNGPPFKSECKRLVHFDNSRKSKRAHRASELKGWLSLGIVSAEARERWKDRQ